VFLLGAVLTATFISVSNYIPWGDLPALLWQDEQLNTTHKELMDTPPDIPLLFTFYFGDSASSAQRGASRRFKKWSRGFDQWVAELRQNHSKYTLRHVLLAWRRLVRQCGKMPWQLTPADIDHHITWLKQEGYAVSTVNGSIGIIAGFYQWCDEQHVDSACPPGFNPAKGASRTSRIPYAGVSMWPREELDAFLCLVQRDSSPLAKRDYAFFLARLSLGVPLKSLQRLTWGQVEQDAAGAWVRWRMDGERVRLPEDVWQAVTDYLRISGRLDGMVAASYIFAPHVQPVVEGSDGKAVDWLEAKPLSNSALISSLKLYGRQLGIPELRLTLMALRRTAIRLRLDQGESLEGMQVFMDTREKIKSTKYRLARLPGLPQGDLFAGHLQESDTPLPVRQTRLLQGGEGTTHGFYARRKDKQAVGAVLAENIQGMDQEIACLRNLMRLLLERAGDEARLMDTYLQAAQRLGVLVSAGKSAHKGEMDTWAEEVLSMADRFAAENGSPPISPRVREEALGISPAGDEAVGVVTEEIATIRWLLRNVYKRAMQGVDNREYLILVDLYGTGCVRLARLLKLGGSGESGALVRYMRGCLDQAIREVHQEFRSGENRDQVNEPGL
jgi:site-specific recombinase XerC